MQEITNKVVNFLIEQGELPAVKEVDRRLLRIENRLANKLVRLQAGLEKEFLDLLEESGRLPSNAMQRARIMSEVFDVPFSIMRDVIAEESLESFLLGRIMGFEDLGITNGEGFAESVRDQLKDKIYEFSEDTFSRIRGDFSKTLSEGYEEGLGIDEVANNLRSDFHNLRSYRLKNIARTEIQSTQNVGTHETLVEYGVRYKQWITAGDSRVRGRNPKDRYDHVELHGQVVRIDEPFSNGLMHPGDRSGRMGQWINCRCIERAYIPRKDERIITTPYYP